MRHDRPDGGTEGTRALWLMAKASPVDLEAAFWADEQTRSREGTKILTSGSGETSLGDGDDFETGRRWR